MNGNKYQLPDMKFVKLLDGRHTIEPANVRHSDRSLCNLCGIGASCKPRASLARLQGANDLVVGVKSCGDFRLTLTFRSNVGMEQEFNTMRLGPAWARRVEVGKLVNLRTTSGEKVGVAKVVSKHVEDFEEALRKHAHMNHVAVGMKAAKARETVRRELVNANGKNFIARAGVLSVIYLMPIKDEADQG